MPLHQRNRFPDGTGSGPRNLFFVLFSQLGPVHTPTPRIEGRVASESLSLGDCRESCVFIGLLVLVGVRYW
jgi:hypothetical protein